MPQRFSPTMLPRDVDDTDTLYVADAPLDIIYSNEEWARFATDNRGEQLLEPSWKGNLLRSLSGKQRDRWRRIYQMLFDGRLPYHQEQLNCSSPAERRTYQLRITPARDDQGDVAWLIHHNVRIDNDSDTVDRVGAQLEELDDPARLAEVFRTRLVERPIQISGFRVARHFEPLDEIGGDLIWHREYENGVCDLFHADVMGHGVAAGRVAAKIAVVLDELASPTLTPSQMVAALDAALKRITPDDTILFATGLGFRFERDARVLTCCNFGHEGPIFSQAGPVQIDSGYAVGLGSADTQWPEVRLELAELGTRFLIFSDGITEQFDAEGEMFDVGGLRRAFDRHAAEPLDAMLRGVVSDLSRFRGAALVKDDQTLLALEFVGSPD
jgi:sigma-B regulation protein RsbU (phosphoserine phosphatase)